MTFEQQLIITIVDKAIIGALIAVGAFVLSRKLERFKSSQALANEYAKQRLEKVASLWEVLHSWEGEAVEFSHVVRRAIGHNINDTSYDMLLAPYSETLTALQNRRRDVKLQIERAQFWLGDDLRKRFLQYYQAIQNHVGNFSGDNIKSAVSDGAMTHLEDELGAVRQSIFAYVRQAPARTE